MSSNPSKPTLTEVHYWFSKAALIAIVTMSLVIFAGQLGVSRMIAPLTPFTVKIQAASDQVIRAQNVSILASKLAVAKRPGLLYTYRTQLAAELDEFVTVHRGLLYGDASRGLSPKMSANLRELLFNPAQGLDRFARDFEDRVRRDFLSDALSVEDNLAEGLQEEVQLQLSPRLREITALLGTEARTAVGRVYAAQVVLIGIAVLIMLVLGRLLYRPLADRVVSAIHDDAGNAQSDMMRFDEVTGLANRTHLLSFMADLCKFSKEHDFRSAVLDIEINGVDAVRTALENKDVDEMMSMIARRIESICRSGDFIARVSDVEFIVVLTGLECDTALNDITNALRTKLSLPFVLETQSFSLKTKIGIKIADKKDQVPAAILNQAATALKISKASDNYDIQFFSGSLAPKASQREKEFQQIDNGLKSGQFAAHFQPIVGMQSGATLGVEALVRWNHPKRGVLSPIHFMETVKNRGLANDLTRAVLGDALKALRDWKTKSIEVPYISINLEADQMADRAFVDEIKWITDSYDQPTSMIAFEFPEDAFMSTAGSQVKESINRLADFGFSIIMDDFGTIGVPLNEIPDVPLQHIKVDRAFVSNLDSETLQQTVTAEMIKQAHANHFNVVAEGVETPAERATLQRLGVDALQGYLVCEPLEIVEITDWLATASHGANGTPRLAQN